MSANSPITLREIVTYEEIIIETSQVEDGRQAMCCYTCQEYGHMSRMCPKKRCEGEDICASSLPKQSVIALPTKCLGINSVFQDVLIDSGCTCCIIYKKSAKKIMKEEVSVVTVNGQQQQCEGVSQARIATPNGNTVCVEALVVNFKLLGFCFLMGMIGIVALGEVSISVTRIFTLWEKTKHVCLV